MSLIPAKCIEYNEERKACVVSEKGKSYRLDNESGFKVRAVKIDKCLQQKEGEKRCDYLMNFDQKKLKRAIFIELKGGGLSDALKQLYATIIYLKEEFKGHRIDARIVGNRDVPDFINLPNYRKLAKEILPTGGTIERGTNNIYKENC